MDKEQDLKNLEEQLKSLEPCEMSPDLLARLARAMDGAAEVTEEENVVEFPQFKEEPQAKRFTLYGLAAAVAVLAAALPFLLPETSIQQGFAGEVRNVSDVSAISQVEFTPESYEQKMVDAHDLGYYLDRDKKTHQLIEVDYLQEGEWADTDGKVIKVNRPYKRLVIKPISTD